MDTTNWEALSEAEREHRRILGEEEEARKEMMERAKHRRRFGKPGGAAAIKMKRGGQKSGLPLSREAAAMMRVVGEGEGNEWVEMSVNEEQTMVMLEGSMSIAWPEEWDNGKRVRECIAPDLARYYVLRHTPLGVFLILVTPPNASKADKAVLKSGWGELKGRLEAKGVVVYQTLHLETADELLIALAKAGAAIDTTGLEDKKKILKAPEGAYC